MKIKGMLFILFAACVGHIGAMEHDKKAGQKPQGMQQGTKVPSLKQLAAIATVKNIVQKIYSPAQNQQQIIDTFIKETPNWSQLPIELREPFLAELGRQYYILYGEALNTGVLWGLSIQDYLDSPALKNKMPQITGRTTPFLKLSNMKINNLQGLQNILNIKTVKMLYLDNNQLTTIQPNAFAGLTNLQLLALNRNQLTTIPTNAFAGLTNLQWLYLNRNQLTTIPTNAFAGLTNLQWLYLDNNLLTTIQTKAFAGLNNLKVLALANNLLSTIQPNAFAGLTKLTILNLDYNQLTTQPNAFADLTNLKTLRLGENRLDEKTKEAIKEAIRKALPGVKITF